MLLLKKMPQADLVLAVGDLCDRGPDSLKVFDYFMNTPNTEALMGNHDFMMLVSCLNFENILFGKAKDGTVYDLDLWYCNGGWNTVQSFGGDITFIGKKYTDWLKARPLYYQIEGNVQNEGLFVSHAPLWRMEDIPQNRYSQDYNIIHNFVWNRDHNAYIPNTFQVYGHNWRLRKHERINAHNKPEHFAQCIDSSSTRELVGLHWPTKELFKQTYLHP